MTLCGWSNFFAVAVLGGGAVDVGGCEDRVAANGESMCVVRDVYASLRA